jgi:TP901 family phage tail tape measure protein
MLLIENKKENKLLIRKQKLKINQEKDNMVNLTGLEGNSVVFYITAKDQFTSTISKANAGLNSFKTQAIAAGVAGYGLAKAFQNAVDTSISFESAFAGVRKTSDLTEKEFADLENRFKEITKVTPVTFEELSKIGEISGQLGVKGVDNLEKFTKVIADIAVTTNLTSESAATSFARIFNVMQEPLDNVDKMGAAIVDLGNNFATTEAEITVFAERMAGAGKIVGLSTADILGISTALSSVGVEAEAGGTAMQKTFLQIHQSVLTGNKDLAQFAQVAGMSVDDFSYEWKTNAARAFTSFVSGLQQSGDSAIQILDDLGISEVRTTRALLSLANAGDILDSAITTSNKAWNENSALTEEANKRYETTASKIQMLKNDFRLLSEEIGNQLAPILTDTLIPALKNTIDWFRGLPEGVQDGIVVFGLVTAGVLLLTGAIAALLFVMGIWLAMFVLISGAILGIGMRILMKFGLVGKLC